MGLPDAQLQKLQLVQNAAARLVNRHSWTGAHNTGDVCFTLAAYSSKDSIKLLLLVYRCTHQLAPAYLMDLVVPYVPARALRSAEQNLLTVKRYNLERMGVVLSRWLVHPYGTPCQALLGTLCLYLLSDPVSKLTFFASRLSLCCRSLVAAV